MLPQHVAPESSSNGPVEALASQPVRLDRSAYQFRGFRTMVTPGRIQAAVTLRLRQAGPIRPVVLVNADRRHRCQRASNFSHWSALLPPLQLATIAVRKSLSWLSRFRSSLPIPASTSNIIPGSALGRIPWPIPHSPLSFSSVPARPAYQLEGAQPC